MGKDSEVHGAKSVRMVYFSTESVMVHVRNR